MIKHFSSHVKNSLKQKYLTCENRGLTDVPLTDDKDEAREWDWLIEDDRPFPESVLGNLLGGAEFWNHKI